jgi:hypothetical protein
MKFKKKSSTVKLLSQSQPNFPEMILGSRRFFFKFHPPFSLSIFSLVAIVIGNQDHQTQFWKVAIQGSFHQSLVPIGPVVSEEKIKM